MPCFWICVEELVERGIGEEHRGEESALSSVRGKCYSLTDLTTVYKTHSTTYHLVEAIVARMRLSRDASSGDSMPASN